MRSQRTRVEIIASTMLFVLTAYCTCFLAASAMGTEGWRVIAEDPKFPTDDVIVAYCSVTDAPYQIP